MISALDSTDGTVHTPIAGYGPAGAKLIYRRINGAGQGTASSSSSLTSLVAASFTGLLVGGGLAAGLAVAILGAAALLGIGGAVAFAAIIRQAQGG